MKSTYVEHVYQNILEDRAELKRLWKRMIEAAEIDPLTAIAASENLVKVADSLTKQTGQLVELAKINQRSELAKSKNLDEEGLSDEELEEVFSTIKMID